MASLQLTRVDRDYVAAHLLKCSEHCVEMADVFATEGDLDNKAADKFAEILKEIDIARGAMARGIKPHVHDENCVGGAHGIIGIEITSDENGNPTFRRLGDADS